MIVALSHASALPISAFLAAHYSFVLWALAQAPVPYSDAIPRPRTDTAFPPSSLPLAERHFERLAPPPPPAACLKGSHGTMGINLPARLCYIFLYTRFVRQLCVQDVRHSLSIITIPNYFNSDPTSPTLAITRIRSRSLVFT